MDEPLDPDLDPRLDPADLDAGHVEVVDRLRALGQAPVAPATAAAHLAAMAPADGAPAPRPARRRWTKVQVGAAFAAGLLLGGTGLVAAGALPGPVRSHGKPAKAGKTGSGGKEDEGNGGGTARYEGPECGPDATYKNHGQYVKAHKGDPAAAASRCGKPLQAGAGGPDDQGENDQGQKDQGQKDQGQKDQGGATTTTPSTAAPAVTTVPPTTAAPATTAPTTTAAPATTTSSSSTSTTAAARSGTVTPPQATTPPTR